LKVLNKQRVLPNFGNAGAVETLVESAAGKAARRSPQADGSIEIRPEDIDDGDEDEVTCFEGILHCRDFNFN